MATSTARSFRPPRPAATRAQVLPRDGLATHLSRAAPPARAGAARSAPVPGRQASRSRRRARGTRGRRRRRRHGLRGWESSGMSAYRRCPSAEGLRVPSIARPAAPDDRSASAGDTPGARRAKIMSVTLFVEAPTVRGTRVLGIQTSVRSPRRAPSKSFGAIPMTRTASGCAETTAPMMSARRSNARAHSRSLMIATGSAPSRSSAVVKPRPRTGTPSRRKYSGVTPMVSTACPLMARRGTGCPHLSRRR